jgi:hypothetical protein
MSWKFFLIFSTVTVHAQYDELNLIHVRTCRAESMVLEILTTTTAHDVCSSLDVPVLSSCVDVAVAYECIGTVDKNNEIIAEYHDENED